MRKRKKILLLQALLLCVFCKAQEVNFTIKGHLQNQSLSTRVMFPRQSNGVALLDSNYQFSLKGSLKEPGLISFHTENSFEWLELWVGEGQIDITLEEYAGVGWKSGDKKRLKIISILGSEETEKNQWLWDYRRELNRKYNHLPLGLRNDSIAKSIYPHLESYVSAHPDSKFSVHLIKTYAVDFDGKSRLLTLLARGKNSQEAKRLERDIQKEQLLKKGSIIANFEQRQLNGKSFSLNSLSGKYVLLEFWASNCPPCRAANPELVKIYKDYHSKGFEIVGISLDNSKINWKKAVKADRLPWIQVSDLKGFNNAISSKYFIDAIPFNILLDKDQKVIATDLNQRGLPNILDNLLNIKPAANTGG